MNEGFHGVSVRTDDGDDLRLDRLALALSTPSKRATKAAAARTAMLAGLDALEARLRAGEPVEAAPRRTRAA